MPTSEEHIFGWDEAPPDEKLQALYDWCNLLTGEVNAARADTRALLERARKLESDAAIKTGMPIAAPKARGEAAHFDALNANSAPLARSNPITLPEPQRTSGISRIP